MAAPVLLQPQQPSRSDLKEFISRHQLLLQQERDEEEEQTRLLNSNCSPKLLEQRGLSLGGLGVASISVGLGGKSLIELCRPLAYHVNTALPPHSFRSGDPVRIEEHVSGSGGKSKSKAKSDESVGLEGVVSKVTAERVVVAVSEGKDVDLPERLRLLKLANSATFDRMSRTLKHLERIVVPEEVVGGDGGAAADSADAKVAANANVPLVRTLLGMQQPTWGDHVARPISALPEDDPAIRWFGERLNDSQKEAIDFCLRADQVACIHGPPGTGKTHTLVELIFQLLARPAAEGTTLPPRILVTTPSNLALDNLLLRLHALSQQAPYSALLPPGSILRLGHPTRVHRDLIHETLDWRATNSDGGELVRDIGKEINGHLGDLGRKRGEKGAVKGRERGKKWEEVRELRKEYRQREAKVVTNVVRSARVVLATCHTAGAKQLNNLAFDVAIVDEATQAIEAVCWVPILKAKKLILAGDPQQLPPTILAKPDNASKAKKVKESNGKGGAAESVASKDDKQPKPDAAPAGASANASSAEDGQNGKQQSRLRPPRTLETTLFDRLEMLYGAGIKKVLKVQYRMNKNIAAFPATTLYNDDLLSDPSVAEHTLLDLPTIADPTSEDSIDLLGHTVVFFDTAGCEFFERTDGDSKGSIGEGSKSNENEAAIVAKWARKLVASGVPSSEVGIVTPYQAQVSLISAQLQEEFPDMTIGSVDGLQGQERDAIILSLVRSNETGDVGFLGEYRRLNVAMTRPRRQLCVVGDSDTVSKGSSYLKKWMAWLEHNADVRYAGDEV
ncbi:hypothetical protein Q8F55_002344 [Vanrija albida]|uniref:DNA helicase n=1 Tax=Vanrija albida TaxID=181172 RepID=A0ABR3Q9N0_9TREE